LKNLKELAVFMKKLVILWLVLGLFQICRDSWLHTNIGSLIFLNNQEASVYTQVDNRWVSLSLIVRTAQH
jgi:hypothetical protein